MRRIEFEKLKVGDKLYSIIGKGMMTVLRLDGNGKMAIYCRDEKGHPFSFSKDGRYFIDDNYPSLYLDPISFGFQERVMEVSSDKINWEKTRVYADTSVGFVINKEDENGWFLYPIKYAREIQQEKKKVVTLELTEDQLNSLKQQGIL